MRELRTLIEPTGRKAPDGRKLERVTLAFDLKSLSEDGTGEGLLSAFGNEDSYGDVVDPGAFTKTIAERSEANPLPFLWQHDSYEPIGVYTDLKEVDDGLYTKFAYALGVQRANEAYQLAKMRACKGQSIGFTTIKDVIDGGVRRLKELKLWEGSQVTFPANELATITNVKAHDLQSAIERLAAEVESLKNALPRVGGPTADEAAVQALRDAVKSALADASRAASSEPDGSTRADDQAVADLRREMESYLIAA